MIMIMTGSMRVMMRVLLPLNSFVSEIESYVVPFFFFFLPSFFLSLFLVVHFLSLFAVHYALHIHDTMIFSSFLESGYELKQLVSG